MSSFTRWATYRRAIFWTIVAWIGAATLEILNRRVLHVLQLYPHMESAGMLATRLTALLSAMNFFLRPPRWWWGLVAWAACVLLFFVTDVALAGSLEFDRDRVESLLPLFYGCSFGALAWTLTAAVNQTSPVEAPRPPMPAPRPIGAPRVPASAFLTGSQRRELQDALISAFHTQPALEQLVSIGKDLDTKLNHITPATTLPAMILEVIAWAEANGKTEALIDAASKQVPDNPKLKQFYEDYTKTRGNRSV